jgi:hypothetical protein
MGRLGFREGTLLQDFGSGKIYLVSGNKLRQIDDPDVLKRLQYTKDDAIEVSTAELGYHTMGEVLR